MKRICMIWMLLATWAGIVRGQNGEMVLDVWPDGPTTASADIGDTARVNIFLPPAERATGRAIVICPGGGYAHLAFEKEGTRWAPMFNEMGIAVVVLKYRMPHGNWRVPTEDAEEAVRMVRRHAEEWHVNPSDVGIMGFSAGGHLAATTATHATGDAHPDFQLLFYPVITMEEGVTHQGSRDNLLGPNPSEELVGMFCNERQVSPQTPPAFLALANDDRAVPPANAVRYYQALQEHRVATALHIYPKGDHGFGINESFPWHVEMMLEVKAWLQSLK